MKVINEYFNSFKFNQKFWKTFAIDTLFFILFLGVLFWLGNSIEAKGQELSNILPAGAASSPEQLLPVMKQLKSFLLYSIFISGFLLTILFFAYSYSRAVIWDKLWDKKQAKNTFWKWSKLNLALLLLLSVYSAVALLILFIFSLFFNFVNNPNITLFLNNLIAAILQLFFILFLFITYNHFVSDLKVWNSIKLSFISIKSKKFVKTFSFTLITVALIYAVRWALRKLILTKISIVYPWAETLTDLIFVLLLFSWLRLLLLKYEHGH